MHLVSGSGNFREGKTISQGKAVVAILLKDIWCELADDLEL